MSAVCVHFNCTQQQHKMIACWYVYMRNAISHLESKLFSEINRNTLDMDLNTTGRYILTEGLREYSELLH
jgi:phosphatidylinositol kinase/protein kinase (PI-3  family)